MLVSLPLRVGVPPVQYQRPLSCSLGGCVEGRWCVCCGVPCLCVGPVLLALSLFLFHPPCVCCHSIAGVVVCLSDGVVSLRDGGVGLCWVEGRVVFTVYTSSVLWCASQRCVCCDDSV